MAATKNGPTSKEKAAAKKIVTGRALVCKPMTCRITDPTCGELTKCDITCKMKK